MFWCLSVSGSRGVLDISLGGEVRPGPSYSDPVFGQKPLIFLPCLKGHSQLMHMRIRYHFLADLHVTRHERETESEKRNTQNKPC